MKDWFPLTSYEFYAYLTSGMVVLAAADRAFMVQRSQAMRNGKWS